MSFGSVNDVQITSTDTHAPDLQDDLVVLLDFGHGALFKFQAAFPLNTAAGIVSDMFNLSKSAAIRRLCP